MNRFARSLAAIVLALLAHASLAAARPVAEGGTPALAPGEGLLLLGVQTPDRIDIVRFGRPGHSVDGGTFDDVRPGTTYRLFAVQAGTYQWSDLEYYARDMRAEYRFGDDAEFRFEVRPGVVNYPGNLLHYPYGMRAAFRIVDRGTSAMDWLQDHFPATFRDLPFAYIGSTPDTFPAFYKQKTAAMPAGPRDATRAPPDPGPLPIPVADLWREERIGVIGMSKDAGLLVEEIIEHDQRRIDLVDLKAGTARTLFKIGGSVDSITWAGNRDFSVELEGRGRFGTVYFVRLQPDAKAGWKADPVTLPFLGKVIYVSRDEPGVVLFESDNTTNGEVAVYRVDMNSLSGLLEMRLRSVNRIDRGVPDAAGWMTDDAGRLRAAGVYRDGRHHVMQGAEGRFNDVFAFDPKGYAEHSYLDGNGTTLYLVTDHDRAQRDLVALDTATGKTTTVFSKPGVDVEEPLFGPHRNLMGVLYHANGEVVKEYFDPTARTHAQRIAAAFPGASVRIEEFDATYTHFIVSVQASDRPRKLYLYDAGKATAELVDDAAPWFEGRHLAPSRIVHATGRDGVPVEAYLTVPVGATAKVPLIVYSHGGPIGVRDERAFDPAVQLFASLGYAVLQVNFRGSDGYGRAFREGGLHNYGALIEDDVDAAIQAVLRDAPVDAQRICAVGASYGGFSALISAIRWPQRFRCVVSISGVTDLALMFSASDSGQTEADRKRLVELIGDPATDGDSLRAHSPAFRYADLTTPVMLAHGTDDARVDYENSVRLARMLTLAGHAPVFLTLQGAGHGGFSAKDNEALWTGVAGFVRAQLEATNVRGQRGDTVTKGQ